MKFKKQTIKTYPFGQECFKEKIIKMGCRYLNKRNDLRMDQDRCIDMIKHYDLENQLKMLECEC